MNEHKQLIRDITSALKMRPFEESLFETEEGRKEILSSFKMLQFSLESTQRRIKELEEERQDLYDRTDMMNIAEYIGRLYDLKGIRDWSLKGDDEILNKTIAQIMIEFERDMELAEREELNKKDIGGILFG